MEQKDVNGVFARSVAEFTSDDIPEREKKKESVIDVVFDKMRYIVLAVCSVVLVASVCYIIRSLIHYGKADDIYDAAKDIIMEGVGDGTPEMLPSGAVKPSPDFEKCQLLSADELNNITKPSGTNAEFARMKIKLTNLKKQYPELYGWIILPNTNINYPIMQHSDNDYYLNHSYTGLKLAAGAIFADYHCYPKLLNNYNLVLYGHHMLSNSMFHPLDKYLSKSFFEKNNKVYIYTLDGIYVYKVFSVYNTDKYYPYIQTQFLSMDSLNSFYQRIRKNSIYPTEDRVLTESDRILTLSTCSNRTEDGRLAVHAILEEVIK